MHENLVELVFANLDKLLEIRVNAESRYRGGILASAV